MKTGGTGEVFIKGLGDSELYASVAAAAATTATTVNSLATQSVLYAYDGSTYGRLIAEVGADALTNASEALVVTSRLAEFNGTTWDRVRSHYRQITGSITGNGAGAALNLTVTPCNCFGISWQRTVGTNQSDIDLEGSADGVSYGKLINTGVGNEDTRWVSSSPCRYIRYNVIGIGLENTVQVQLLAMR